MTHLDDIRTDGPSAASCGDAAAPPVGRGASRSRLPRGQQAALAVGLWAEGAFAAGDDAGESVGCGPECGHGGDHDHYVGGQAILEGVMMRGRHSWGLAVRQSSGSIARHSFDLPLLSERHPLFKLPVVRGIGALWESLSLGIKALSLSANLSLGEGPAPTGEAADPGPARLGEAADPGPAATEEATADGLAALDGVPTKGPAGPVASEGAEGGEGGAVAQDPSVPPKDPMQLGFRELAISMVLAMVVAVGLFIALPLFVAKLFGETLANPFLFNLTEGVVRLAIFVAYILVISRLPDLRRVFEYHGAEHKTIHAYEAGDRLDPEQVEPLPDAASPLRHRVPSGGHGHGRRWSSRWSASRRSRYLILSRLVGIPMVAGLSYEVIRYGGRHKDGCDLEGPARGRA